MGCAKRCLLSVVAIHAILLVPAIGIFAGARA